MEVSTKGFMVAFLFFLALIISPTLSREITSFNVRSKGEEGVVASRGDVNLASRPPLLTPPSPQANGGDPGGISGSRG